MQIASGGHDNNTAVRNCTLKDIDAACLEFQRYELAYVIRNGIVTYANSSLGLTEVQGGSGSGKDWFNCQSQEDLSTEAISYILEQIG